MFLNADCPVNKIDSNVTGLRYAWEECLGQLPDNPIWRALEPNSYSDFGPTVNTVTRNPINPNRSMKKGTVTGVDATAGFAQDLTFNNTTDLLQGFFFAGAREKATTAPLNTPGVAITGVVDGVGEYTAASGLDSFAPGDIVVASGFSAIANNGVKIVDTASATAVAVTPALAAEASPPAGAKLIKVGTAGDSGDLSISLNGLLVRLESAASYDFRDMGLIEGEWIFIGGDGAAERFANNVGFARISAIEEDYLEFDKVSWPDPQAETGAGLTVQLYFGTVIRNEPDPALIKRGSVQLERTLGQDADGTMSEYMVGSVPNELTMNVAQEDKITVDLGFVSLDAEHRSGAQGLKPGSRPPLVATDAFNTSSDFARIKLASVSEVDANPVPLFAFATDLSLSVNNNVSANKAIGHISAIDTTAGTFTVSGEITAYFASVAAVQAVRNNASVTLDIVMAKDNIGLLFDIPLLSLGNGRLNVEQDQAITVPLETNAAESKFGHTLLFQSFPYLPNAAM